MIQRWGKMGKLGEDMETPNGPSWGQGEDTPNASNIHRPRSLGPLGLS